MWSVKFHTASLGTARALELTGIGTFRLPGLAQLCIVSPITTLWESKYTIFMTSSCLSAEMLAAYTYAQILHVVKDSGHVTPSLDGSKCPQ